MSTYIYCRGHCKMPNYKSTNFRSGILYWPLQYGKKIHFSCTHQIISSTFIIVQVYFGFDQVNKGSLYLNWSIISQYHLLPCTFYNDFDKILSENDVYVNWTILLYNIHLNKFIWNSFPLFESYNFNYPKLFCFMCCILLVS